MKKQQFDFSSFDLDAYVKEQSRLDMDGFEDFLLFESVVRAKKECESPIEQMLLVHLMSNDPSDMAIKTQVYLPLDLKIRRVDFLIGIAPPVFGPIRPLFVVETDGKYHNDEEQIMKDKTMDREILTKHSLPVVRFTGREVVDNAGACADEVHHLFNVYKQNLMAGIFTNIPKEKNYFHPEYNEITLKSYKKFKSKFDEKLI